MKLIIGLGNPGKEYRNTRHNVGYMVIDELKNQKSKIKNITVAKTDKFMNESGEFIKKLLLKYPSIPVSSIYVIHDDLDIKLGEYKIQLGHGPKDHNGVISIDEALGTDEYWHVKIGIDSRPLDGRPMGEEYVLQDFTPEERTELDKVIKEVCHQLKNL